MSDDVAMLGFTSGSTGDPKATMHFHRYLLIIADGYASEVLGVTPDDIFVGSPPLAFTFGLGGLAIFPLRFGAAATLLEVASPPHMIEIIEKYRATICFTSPTAYRAMLRAMDEGADLSSLRAAVSAGETLPAPVYNEWIAKTGKPMLDGIGQQKCYISSFPIDLMITHHRRRARLSQGIKPKSLIQMALSYRVERRDGLPSKDQLDAGIWAVSGKKNMYKTDGTFPVILLFKMMMATFIFWHVMTT